MDIIIYTYKDIEIEFYPTGKDENVIVNASQMAKPFNKKPKDFLKNENTDAFLKECLTEENSPQLGVNSKQDLVVVKANSGTWMHKILALKFAAWLSPAFELWVYITIDKIIHETYRKIRDVTKKKYELKERKATKKKELLTKHPEIAEYFELEEEEKKISNQRSYLIRQDAVQMKIQFHF